MLCKMGVSGVATEVWLYRRLLHHRLRSPLVCAVTVPPARKLTITWLFVHIGVNVIYNFIVLLPVCTLPLRPHQRLQQHPTLVVHTSTAPVLSFWTAIVGVRVNVTASSVKYWTHQVEAPFILLKLSTHLVDCPCSQHILHKALCPTWYRYRQTDQWPTFTYRQSMFLIKLWLNSLVFHCLSKTTVSKTIVLMSSSSCTHQTERDKTAGDTAGGDGLLKACVHGQNPHGPPLSPSIKTVLKTSRCGL